MPHRLVAAQIDYRHLSAGQNATTNTGAKNKKKDVVDAEIPEMARASLGQLPF
jgi:hypothetical protein